MSTVNFSFRLIFDESFYNSEIKRDPKLLMKLMYINDRAQGNKRRFNILSKKSFQSILSKNPSMPRQVLRASFYDIDEEDLEVIVDEIERTIKYAIHVVKENPEKKSLILTSESNVQYYLSNPHYINSKDITVKSGKESAEIIEDMFQLCTDK